MVTTRENPFAHSPRTPANHFKLYSYAAVLYVIRGASQALGSTQAAAKQFPFLKGYQDELAEYGVTDASSEQAASVWIDSLRLWETTASSHLPLLALDAAGGLGSRSLAMLMTIGLVEEDPRFAYVFEYLQGTTVQQRPTAGLVQSWFRDGPVGEEVSVRRLEEQGLVRTGTADLPRSCRPVQIPAPLWDAMRGDQPERPAVWARYRGAAHLAGINDVLLPAEVQRQAKAVSSLLQSGEARAIILRGSQHNGRGTLLRAIAAALGRGVLEISGAGKSDDDRWSLAGPLATLLHAMPVIAADPAPGETAELPRLEAYGGPVGITLPKQGGVAGPAVERAITLTLPMPDPETRRRHWLQALPASDSAELDSISERFRMPSGNIRRTARLAVSYAALEGRAQVIAQDVRQASRTLNRQALDTLARQVETAGDWDRLAVAPQTMNELCDLESRCRHRERLVQSAGPTPHADLNAGVRALFCGPSGTGKTLAAQLLASRLETDLYRLDLASVVNKYIGETEKNLSKVFARAEELDILLLLDEGDALLTQRTAVQSSNDRYANLETNYLLQRLESFEGILIVTTNTVERIDRAFQRRMDVVVEFRPPEAAERWSIWQMHLPAAHQVDAMLLEEVASRCVMSGGQIRNASLHASVLAFDDGGVVRSAHVESAVQREYRKLGGVCPLRRGRAFAALRE